MSDITLRLGIVTGVCILTLLLLWSTRRFIEQRKQRVLAAPSTLLEATENKQGKPIRILAFSSDDCRQCHQLQAPALQRVVEARNDVSIVEVDAPSSPELTERYSVLTVPTTVVLDAAGKAHAVNYGFTNTKRLLEQIDTVLALI
jgi:thioredoxin-like negative regulator of GroEL